MVSAITELIILIFLFVRQIKTINIQRSTTEKYGRTYKKDMFYNKYK